MCEVIEILFSYATVHGKQRVQLETKRSEDQYTPLPAAIIFVRVIDATVITSKDG